MKSKCFINAALAASIVAAGVLSNGITSQAACLSGDWENTESGWKFRKTDGSYAYSEYVDGWWVDGNGIQNGEQAFWNQDQSGQWYGNSDWYAKNGTYTIDGVSYTFDSNGYLCHEWQQDSNGWRYILENGDYACNEWIDGYWFNADGYCNYEPRAQWYQDSKGWYYMDSSGYYIKNDIAVIDYNMYFFDQDGYVRQFTKLKQNVNVDYDIDFELSAKNKDTAEYQLDMILSDLLASENGSLKGSRDIIVDGKELKVSYKNRKIYIGKDDITTYVKKSSSSIKVGFKSNTNQSGDIKAVLFRECDYNITKVSFGGVTFSNIKNLNSNAGMQISAQVDGKTYNIIYEKLGGMKTDFSETVGTISIEGDARNASWVKTLKSDGLYDVKSDLEF